MPFFLVIIAASLASIANFFIRKNLDNYGSAHGHFFASFAASLAVSLLMNPQILHVPFSSSLFLTGFVTGILIVAMMGLTALTLAQGPSGLTFAFQTSGSVFPALLLFCIFGSAFGFTLTLTMLLGLTLVVIGLLWASYEKKRNTFNLKWLLLALSIFALHILLLVLIQWRTLTFADLPDHPLILFKSSPIEDIWFSPGMFSAAFLLQCFIVWKTGTKPSKRDLFLGSLGGSFNGVATYFLLLATAFASPLQKGILFPAFSVGIILICNLWGYLFYKEKVHWYAHSLCSLGIFLASN